MILRKMASAGLIIATAVVLAGCQGKTEDVTAPAPTTKPITAPANPTVAEAPPVSSPAAVDLSSPKATLKSFAAAMEKGDTNGVKAVSISDPKSDQLLEIVVPTMGAMKRLNDSAVKKFGAAGKTVADDSGKGMDFAKDVDNAKIEIKGDTATAVIKDPKDPAKLKRVNGEWKIDFASAMGSDVKSQDIKTISKMFTGLNKAATDSAAEIDSGMYKTADEAKQAVGMKLMAALFGGMADMMKDGAKKPGAGTDGPAVTMPATR